MLAKSGQVRTESVRLCGGGVELELEPPVPSCCRLTGLVLLSQWRTGECDPSQHGLPWSLVRPLQGVCHEGESNPRISYNSTQLSRSPQPLAQANGLILLEIIGNINVVDLNRIVDCYFKFQGY